MTTGPVLESFALDDETWVYSWDGLNWALLAQGPQYASSYYRERPISVNNVVRADLTRAPSAFMHRGSHATGLNGTFIGTDISGTRVKVVGQLAAPLDYGVLSSIGAVAFDPTGPDRSMLKALLKVKNSKVNLGVALAEARKTAAMLGKSATRVANTLDSFMSRNVRQLGRMASWKKIPAAFLELSYGWTPLLNDVYGSAQALAEVRELGTLLSLSVKAKVEDKNEIQVNQGMYFSGIPVITTLEVDHLYITKLVYLLPDHLLGEFSSLGLTNPLEIVWEIVPYSFVLDWFIPVGNWLSALDAGSFLEFKEGSQSAVVRPRFSRVDLEPTGLQSVDTWTGKASCVGFNFQRYVTVPYMPMLTRNRVPLSLDKMAKGLSLLTQVMRKWA